MLNFEISKRRNNTEVEKYTFPVLTINEKNTSPKSVQKFEFNQAAVDQLKIIPGQYVGLAFDSNQELVIVNLDNKEAPFSAKVNKDFTFNSKKIFDKLVKHYSLDETVVNEMALSVSLDEEDDYFYANMNLISDTLYDADSDEVPHDYIGLEVANNEVDHIFMEPQTN